MSAEHPALASPEALMRALKAPFDPPFEDGMLKIELATEAWRKTSLYVPAKAEVLGEWVLGNLLRNKDKEW